MTSPGATIRPLFRRPLRSLLWAFALAAVLGLMVRGVRAARSATSEPGLGAQWIWVEGDERNGTPIAFLALRDVFLDEKPSRAWMAVTVDESYVLHINGQPVAGGEYSPGQEMDLHSVGDYLKAGWNRLVIEARSGRGSGGILTSLRLEERGRVHLGSDASWRILRHALPGVVRGWDLADQGEAPRVWGRGQLGRWRVLPPGAEVPMRSFGPQFAPASARQGREHFPAAMWKQPRRPGKRFPRMGLTAVYDWGRVLEGYLELTLPAQGVEPSLLFYGEQPPDLLQDRPAELMVAVPGSERWLSPRPRRFRYVLVAGVSLRYPPRTLPVGAGQPLAAGKLAAPAGVFGLSSLEKVRSRQEVEVWRRLSPP